MKKTWVWVARIMIMVVTFLNLQAAFYFMLQPQDYAAGFELTGEPGRAMIQGVGLLFLMWNIPYIVAAVNPLKHFVSLIEAVIMQAVGVIGETLILFSLQGQHTVIRSSVMRFIYFDSGGLILLLIAFFITTYLLQMQKARN